MEAKDIEIIDLIGKKDRTFYVPFYQRKYTWKANEQIKTFWEDLMFYKNEECKDDFFLGTIIIKKTNDIVSKHILVDGQQRITTLFLLISALINCSNRKRDLDEYNILKAYIESPRSEEKKFKLERIKDSDTIRKILNGDLTSITEEEKKSNYYKNYQYFCDQINELNTKDDKFIADFTNFVLQRIKVALINLNHNEDEFSIFESINSKGKELSTADLIKNYLTMNIADSDEILKKFENDFVQHFDTYDNPEEKIVDFYRQIFAIKFGVLYPKKGSKMYFKFKEYFNDCNKENIKENVIKVIDDFIEDRIIFEYINKTDFEYYTYPLINSSLNNFYALIHVSVKANSKIKDKKLEITNFENIKFVLKYLSSLVVARTLAAFSRIEGNRTYAKLAYDLKRELENGTDFKEAFQKKVIDYLKNETSNYRMPSEKEIFDINSKHDLYPRFTSTITSIFIAIEEKISSKKIDKTTISIEHIFPQKESEWEKVCIENNVNPKISFKDMKEWLHTLGNLTILDKSDNSKVSNKIFGAKKKIIEKKSYLKINNMLYDYNEWGIEQVKDRAQKILDYIREIWFSN